jgi:hypothetical protein
MKTKWSAIVAGVIILAASNLFVRAQGTVQFFNSALSKVKYQDTPSSPIVDAPPGIVVGLFWGRSPDTLALQTPTYTIVNPGLFGTSTTTGVFPLPGTSPGETVFLKVAGWYNKGGVTPLAIDGRQHPGITHYGESEVVQSTTLGPTAGPGTVIWQGPTGSSLNRARPFVVAVVPEPSTFALLALGLGAVVLRRFRRA